MPFNGPANHPRDYSIAGASITGSSQALFPDVTNDACNERFIHNPSASATLWVHPLGGAATANTAGSIGLAPGQSITLPIAGPITVKGVTGQGITAYER